MPWTMVLYVVVAIMIGVNLGITFMAIIAGRDPD